MIYNMMLSLLLTVAIVNPIDFKFFKNKFNLISIVINIFFASDISQIGHVSNLESESQRIAVEKEMKLEDGPKPKQQLPDVSPLIPPINFLGRFGARLPGTIKMLHQ